MDTIKESTVLDRLDHIAMMMVATVENVPHECTMSAKDIDRRMLVVDSNESLCKVAAEQVEHVLLLMHENDSSLFDLYFEDNLKENLSFSSPMVSYGCYLFSLLPLRDLNYNDTFIDRISNKKKYHK
jgi:hypothetical protein